MTYDSSLKGLSGLDIWVTKLREPCMVSDRTWYVSIFHCDGKLLEYCGRKFLVLRAPCGKLSVEVPPGCYLISAVWGYTRLPDGNYQANHFTHKCVVEACCNVRQCCKLYNPTIHRCGRILNAAARDLVPQLQVHFEAKVAVAQAAVDAAALPVPTELLNALQNAQDDLGNIGAKVDALDQAWGDVEAMAVDANPAGAGPLFEDEAELNLEVALNAVLETEALGLDKPC